jgi:GNAT superfamily N-acetyltransferase
MSRIEVATHKDVEEIIDVAEQFWSEHYYSEYGDFDESGTRTALHALVDGEACTLIVAKEGDVIAGYIAFILALVPWGSVRSAAETLWWVLPEYRGTGIGKELFDAGLEWAEIMECDLMEAHDGAGKRIHVCVTSN